MFYTLLKFTLSYENVMNYVHFKKKKKRYFWMFSKYFEISSKMNVQTKIFQK